MSERPERLVHYESAPHHAVSRSTARRIAHSSNLLYTSVVLGLVPMVIINGTSVTVIAAAACLTIAATELLVPHTRRTTWACNAAFALTAGTVTVLGIISFWAPVLRVPTSLLWLGMLHLMIVGALGITVDLGATSAARWWRATLATVISTDVLTFVVLVLMAGGVGFGEFDWSQGPGPAGISSYLSIGDRAYYSTSDATSAMTAVGMLGAIAILVALFGSIGSTRQWARANLRTASSRRDRRVDHTSTPERGSLDGAPTGRAPAGGKPSQPWRNGH